MYIHCYTSNRMKTKTQKFYQGYFDKYNPVKYVGERPIIYRSSWELKFMQICEFNGSVKKWSSEQICITYTMIERDKNGKQIEKKHHYYPDFVVELVNGKKYLIEIKPESQSPKSLTAIKNSFIMYKNAMKWKAALEWCKINDYEFKVVSEKHLKTRIFI